jgi:hypothetical protein
VIADGSAVEHTASGTARVEAFSDGVLPGAHTGGR